MLRRMEWRRLPQDPRSPLAWWWREASAVFCRAALVGLFATCFVSALLNGWVFLIVVHGALFALLGWRVVATYRGRALPALAALAPSPAPAEAFPVEFALMSGKVCTGRDQGVASVVDGWLHVEGLRTSFSLRPIDTTRIGVAKNGADVFSLPGGQRIEVRPLGSAADRDTFHETIRVWHRFNFGSPVGEPTLPPLEVHASAAMRPLSMLAFGIALFLGVLGLGAFLWGQPSAIWFVLAPSLVQAFYFCGEGLTSLQRLAVLDRCALRVDEAGALGPPEETYR